MDAATFITLDRALRDPKSDIVTQIHDLLAAGVHPAPHLPNSGYMQSYDSLEWADANIHTLPVEEQAYYADMIARAAVHNDDVAMKVFGVTRFTDIRQLAANAGACTIGSYAYIMMLTRNEELKTILGARLAAWEELRGKTSWWQKLQCLVGK